ncbi:MAG: CPBP family intramembrane metalloprotease [Gemmatimonadetes bacterium]|nr:CPBP family intramembrane metalloprotease [Gemmatimonadota bacterium]
MTSDIYPSLTRTAGLLLATLLVAAGLAAVAYEALPGWPEIVRMALPTEIALALALAWAVRKSGLGWRRALAWRRIEGRHLLPLGLVVVGSMTVFSELYVVIQKLAPVPEAFEAALRELLEISGPLDAIATLAIAVVVAPALEEALFRGAILQGLARRYGPRSATVWTAVFFALFHLYNPWQVVPTFFLGIVLAWLVLTTRSLFSAVLVHSTFNAASLAVFAADIEAGPRAAEEVPWLVAGIVVLLVAGSLCLLGGMAWIERQTGGGWFRDVTADSEDRDDDDAGSGYPVSSTEVGPSTARR